MSIELLPADQLFTEKFTVRRNQCNCHPETCCCRDWAIYTDDGEKYDTYMHRERADEIAKLLNDSEQDPSIDSLMNTTINMNNYPGMKAVLDIIYTDIQLISKRAEEIAKLLNSYGITGK